MGCSASKRTQGQVISVKINAGPTVSSSGLQAASDGNINSNLLEGSQVYKEKGLGLSTSLPSSPVGDSEIPGLKFEQAIAEKLPTVNLPPKDNNYPDFSFKRNDESSREMDRENGFNNNMTLGLSNSGVEQNLRKDSRNNTTARFLNGNSLMVENRNSDRNPILVDTSGSVLPNSILVESKPHDTEGTNSCQKRNADMAGLAFSFMNVKFDNSSQPNVFSFENNHQMAGQTDNKSPQTQFINPFNSRFSFAAPAKESERQLQDTQLMALSEVSSLSCQSTARGHLEHRGSGDFPRLSHDSRTPSPQKMPANSITIINSLNVNIEEKRKFSLLSTQQENNSTHPSSSLGTIVSLGSLCKDENKKAALNMRFTRNLLDLVKPPSTKNLESLKGFSTKSLNTIGDLPDELGLEGKPSLYMSAKVASASTIPLGTRARISSRTKLDMRANLLDLAKEDDEEDEAEVEVDEPISITKRISSEKKKKNNNINSHRSIEFQNLEEGEEIQEEAPSSIVYHSHQNSMNNITRSPNNFLLSRQNSSFSRVDGSTFMDKTIYNLEDNITRMDLDKYSIYEQIDHVEVDDRSNISGNDNISMNRILDYKGLNTSMNQQDTSGFLPQTPTEPTSTKNIFTRMRPKSICEVDKGKVHDTSGTFLSPAMIPMQSLTNLPSERPSRREYYKASSTVIETRQVDKSVDDEGQKKINQYLLIKDLGRGGFGKVKLALHSETKAQYAIKIANKQRLKKKLLTRSKSAYNQLATEIAIMKKMDHPNIVRLFEVIDDPNNDNLYLTMEFIKKGSVLSRAYWKHEMKTQGNSLREDDSENLRNLRLSEEKAKKYFRHLVLALDYLHNTVGIIHRDIKPENLLISEDDVLKVSDFGISKIMSDGDDLLENNAGTKMYLAPETWKGKSFKGKPADIWAAGGTLYYFMFGKPPFQGFSVDEVKHKIIEKELEFPADVNVNPEILELIRACLIKDPDQRITLDQIMQNKWLTDNGMNPLIHVGGELTLNDDDISKALTKISFMAAIMVTAKVKRRANQARLNVERKRSQTSRLQVPIHETPKHV